MGAPASRISSTTSSRPPLAAWWSANAPSFPAPPHGRPGSQEEPRHGRRHGGRSLGGQHQGCGEGTQPGGRPRHPENKHHEHALREVQDPKHSPVHLHCKPLMVWGRGGQAGRQSRRQGSRWRRRRRVLEINHVKNSDVPPNDAHLHTCTMTASPSRP
jgi:hypothetical protein